MIENRHRLDFADTLHRPPVACLGVALQPYSIGHELELLRLRSPFVLETGLERILGLPANRLAEVLTAAVDVCSQTETDRHETGRLLSRRVSLWNLPRALRQLQIRAIYRKWEHSVAACDIITEAISFWNYLCAGRTGPEYAPIEDGTPSVPIGAPEMAILIQYLRTLPEKIISAHGQSELDYPLALARYEFATRQEQAGLIRLQPDNSQSFADWCAEQETLLQAGKITIPPVAPIQEETCQV